MSMPGKLFEASGEDDEVRVLTAMGVALGYHNTEAEVDALLATLPRCVERVRRAALEML